MKIEFLEYITRSDLQANPTKLFLFGDNLIQKGLGGQAKEMRGEPNALGIPTKKLPSMKEEAFFTDDEFYENIFDIEEAFDKIDPNKWECIVIPSAGLGTGLAQLPTRAPDTLQFIEDKIKRLKLLK